MDNVAILTTAALLLGAVIGAVVTYRVMKETLAQRVAAGVADVEAARISLAEQLKATENEAKGLFTRLADSEQQIVTLRDQNTATLSENASLLERTKSIELLENQLADRTRLAKDDTAEIAALRERNGKLSAEVEGKTWYAPDSVDT